MKLKQIANNCHALEMGHVVLVFSYETLVIVQDIAGTVYVTDAKYSRTTSKHLSTWLDGMTRFERVSPDYLEAMAKTAMRGNI